jgi:hypothetical protein
MRPRHTIRLEFFNADSRTVHNRAPLELHFGEGYKIADVHQIAGLLRRADEVKIAIVAPIAP